MTDDAGDAACSTHPTFRELVLSHAGNNVDKWEANLERYDHELLALRDSPISILEIGIHNGGSLEIWAKYFPRAQHIIGLDINPRCRLIEFNDPRIDVVIGDIMAANTHETLASLHDTYDLIVDDGSHHSRQIIHGFLALVHLLRPGGLYVIEDLCCSYWQEFEGGVRRPDSSMNFLKRLVDVVNTEHWLSALDAENYLSEATDSNLLPLAINRLLEIESITFSNSMCVIRMTSDRRPSRIGRRLSRGETSTVSASALERGLDHIEQAGRSQEDNPHNQ